MPLYPMQYTQYYNYAEYNLTFLSKICFKCEQNLIWNAVSIALGYKTEKSFIKLKLSESILSK